jgi:uncharacterized membrane protein YeaQ/YmgE (transglycosylase-associated protein family)
MNLPRRILVTVLVFTVFAVVGVVGSFFTSASFGSFALFPIMVLPATFCNAVSGCITWVIICRKNTDWCHLAGILTVILSFPIFTIVDRAFGLFGLVTRDPQLTFSEHIQMAMELFLYFGIPILPIGLVGGLVCRLLLKKLPGKPAVDGADAD